MLEVTHPDDLLWLVLVAALAMGFMAWGIGANDVANSFGTAFGAKALTAKQAVGIAAVCELAGAVLMGANVADTIRKGMMDSTLYAGDEGRTLMMVGMTAVLWASGTWLMVASRGGLPVSTTHSAVGGVIAFAVASKGWDAVKWDKVGQIVASWVISPVFSGVVGFGSYWLLNKLVLSSDNVLARAKVAGPFIVFLMTLVVAFFTIYKGGKGIGLDDISAGVAIAVSCGIAALFGGLSIPTVKWWMGRNTTEDPEPAPEPEGSPPVTDVRDIAVSMAITDEGDRDTSNDSNESSPMSPPTTPVKSENPEVAALVKKDKQSDPLPTSSTMKPDQIELEAGAADPAKADEVEKLFRGFVVIVAGFMSLAHGANDVANSVGPFGAVLAAFDGEIEKKTEIPVWVFCVAGGMICVGLGTYGYRVMATIGTKVTPLNAPKAFCANWAATLVILIATRAGIPVSTTHASVGAVMGVGLVGGRKNVDWKIMAKIGTSWVITLPICALAMASVFSFLLPCVVDVPFITVNASCSIETTCNDPLQAIAANITGTA